MGDTIFTIGQLAKEVELPVSTIRYYERRGLLQSPSRSDGNYRLYDQRTVERVCFIRSAQLTGFKLDDIQMLLSLENGAGCPCGKVKTVLENRLKELNVQLNELRKVKKSLENSIAICEQADAEDRCGVISEISNEISQKIAANGKNRR